MTVPTCRPKLRPSVFLAAGLLTVASACQSDRLETESKALDRGDGDASRGSADATRPAEASDWKSLGYDLSSTYHNRKEQILSVDNVGDLEVAWTFEAASQVNGAPAVVGDRVYFAGGETYALDASTGEVIWNAPVQTRSAPAYDEGRLYVHARGSVLHCLDAETGEEIWQVDASDNDFASGTSSPIVAGDLVIVGLSSGEEGSAEANATFRGAVVAFDKMDGTERWRRATAEEPYNGSAVWSTVSVDLEGRTVFATTGNNYTELGGPRSDSILAIDMDSGEYRWWYQATKDDVFTILNPNGNPDDDFGANPILFEATIDGETKKLVGAGQKSGTFWVFDRATGEVVWSRDLSDSNALTGGMLNNGAYDGERFLVSANNSTSEAPGSEPPNGEGTGLASVLTALDPETGDILWERQLPAVVWAPITVANGVGFVAYEKHLQAFDVIDGRKLFTYDVEGTIACAPTIANGRVYFGSGMSYFAGTPDRTLHVLELP